MLSTINEHLVGIFQCFKNYSFKNIIFRTFDITMKKRHKFPVHTLSRLRSHIRQRMHRMQLFITIDFISTCLTAPVKVVMGDAVRITPVRLTRPRSSKPTALTHGGSRVIVDSSTLPVVLTRRLTCWDAVCSVQLPVVHVRVRDSCPLLAPWS